MKKIPIFGLLVSVFWFLNCGAASAKEVTLIYTGETHAMLYPCNCPIEPDGGVARRAALIKQLRKTNPDILLLDSGNFFSSGLLDQNTQNTQLDMQRAAINLRAMELMQYDALNISDDEFNFGEAFLQENIGKLKLRFISANLKSDKISPYIIKDAGGVRFGIIGLTNPKAKEKLQGLKFTEPVIPLKDSIASLKKSGASVIIVLSNLGEEEDLKLINAVSGIDILIDGHNRLQQESLVKSGSTIILKPAWQGRKLGKAALSIKDGRVVNCKAEEIRLSDKINDDSGIISILPRCFSDGDCKKKGFAGSCQNAGNIGARCLFNEVTKVNLTVITFKNCLTCNAEKVSDFLREQFPGLKVTYLYYPEKTAVSVVKGLNISGLPAYLLGKEADKEQGFSKLKDKLEARDGFYMLKYEVSGVSWFLNRKKVNGRLDLFLSLYDKNAYGILEAIRGFNPWIHFLAVQQGDKIDTPTGILETEDDLRAVCVQKYYPNIFSDYISCRAKNINSSWWDDCLKGLDTEKIKACARGGEGGSLLKENVALNSELKIMFGPTYLLNNQEIFGSKGVLTKEALKKIIKR